MSGRPPGWRAVFRLPFRARQVEADVDEEIAFHLATRAERLSARGVAPDDAWAVAVRRFGDVERARRECLEIDRRLARRRQATDFLEDLMHDVLFALRGLRRAPGFATAALVTLALGIGAATAIFSVAYGVLLRPLPFASADRLMDVSVNLAGTGTAWGSLSAPEYMDLARGTRSFDVVSAWSPRDRTLGGDGRPERIPTASATASFFDVLGVRAVVGRTFGPEEDMPGAALVIVLGDNLWRRRFDADPTVVGRTVEIDGLSRTVVGVLPPGIRVGAADAYLPLALDPAGLPGRGAHYLRVIGRLRDGVTQPQAREDVAGFATQTMRDNPTNYNGGLSATARPLREAWYGDARPMMTALLGTVLLLLLLAAVNVANLLLVRAEARQREMGVRVALGASRGRLVRQLLTESLLLALCGAIVGVPLAALGVRSLLAISPGVVPPGAEVTVDGGVLAAVVAVVAIAALVAGLAPALRAGSTDVRETIAAGSVGGGRRGGRLRTALVTTEIALAAAMLVGAGLVGRSFQKLMAVDPGFTSGGALVMDISLPRVRYDTSTKVLAFYERALEGMRALPGVRAAAATASLPLGGGTVQWSLEVEGRPGSATELSTPYIVNATPDIFRALGISVVRGRTFAPEDGPTSVPVTVVSEALAREYWPREDAVGKRLRLSGENDWMTIVGIVSDVRPEALAAIPRPTYYVLPSQFAQMAGIVDQGMTIVLRAEGGDPAALTTAARAVVRALDPELPLHRVQTLTSVVSNSIARPRFAVTVLAAFGLSALVLAVVGVYGVLSHAMTRRRRELAVRMALGSRPGEVRRLVMGSGLRLAVAGLAIGLVAAVAGARVLEALLYEVSPTDPLTLVLVGATLLVAAAAASWLPARRATKVSPAEVLRGE